MGRAARNGDPILFFLGRGDHVWGLSLKLFLKKITSSFSHVLIIIININMMKQLCTRTI